MDYSAFHWAEKARKYAETIGTVFNVKGRVNTTQDLPASGNKVGDLWLVGLVTDSDLLEYAWLSFDNVARWEKIGSTATAAFSTLTGSPYDNTSLGQALNAKQNTIDDLATIRSGASLGATAVQPSQLGTAAYQPTTAFATSVQGVKADSAIQGVQVNGVDLTPDANKKVNVQVPTNTNQLTNGAGFITSSALNGYATQTWVGQQGYATASALTGKVDLDFNNMNPSATAKETIIEWGMPSDTFIDLSFAGTAVGKYEYTAPANGYLVINFTASPSGGSVILTSDSNTPSSTNILQQVSSSGHRGTIFYPMKKGKTVYFQVSINSLYTLFNQRFYYAEGDV